jgi:CHAT domain-containing protein
VESEAARDLMVNTVRLMRRGNGRSEALREAKLGIKGSVRRVGTEGLETRDIRIVARPSVKKPGKREIELSLSHPYFWAPFVLVGEGR